MNLSRRRFLQGVAAGAAAATLPAGDVGAFGPREPKTLPPNAVGMLYDSTLCIGCRACVAACKEANGMPAEQPPHLASWNEGTWDTAEDLSGKTLNVIRVYQHGTMEQKDRETDGYAFVKRHCLHCVDPSCISVCPVSAMQKDPDTGIVSHDPDACIGCRYCVYACPFSVPQYQFDEPFGEIAKCQFCNHLQKEGKLPACCDVCPTGASLFGRVDELRAEAMRRKALVRGEPAVFERGKLGGDRPPHEVSAAKYQDHVYGESEAGGTQVLYLTGVPHEKLGLPRLGRTSHAAISEGLQGTLYRGFIAPIVLLVGLLFVAHRNVKLEPDAEWRGRVMAEVRQPLGGKILTGPFLFLAVLACIGVYFVIERLLFGLGAVSNLNGGYPWGIWIAIDVIVGTALGCVGFSVALLVYIFNRNRYHPLMRPALMASLFGYSLAGIAVMLDLGRYWQAYNLVLPWYAQPKSILFEVAVCIGAYVFVLFIEFSPTFLERFGRLGTAKSLKKIMFVFVALGVLLPTMHQSSLGTMLLVMGSQLSPLWYTPWLPLVYLITSIAMGYGVVMLEATLVTNAFHLPSHQRILSKISLVVAVLLAVFLVIRFADIAYRGSAGLIFAGDFNSFLFQIETVLFVAATLLLASPRARRNQRLMFLAAVAMLVAGALYRIDGYLIAYAPGNGWVYFPAVDELMITIGIFAFEIMLYLIFIKKLPVLSGALAAGTGQEA